MANRAMADRVRPRAWARGAVGLLALLAVVACENGSLGIFHTLATESERANRNLDDNLTVGGVVKVGSHYYVAAGGLWRRATGQGSWQVVGRPGSSSEPLLVLGMARSGETLCAATIDGVHYATADSSAPRWKKAVGVTGQVLRVFAIPGSDDQIVAITESHDVYLSTDCESFSKVTLPDGASGRPFDALLDNGTYWLTVGDQVYRATAQANGSPDREWESAHAPDEGEYRGIWCATDTHAAGNTDQCYFANTNGGIYRWDGTEWHEPREIESPSDNIPMVLTLFVRIADKVLVGTESFGFYQFDVADVELDGIARGPRSTSQLYQAHITLFADFGEIVFAGTAGDGLSSIEARAARDETGTWDWE